MKKICYSAFIAFWSSVATMWALHVLAAEEGGATGSPAGQSAYTLAEVAKHDSQQDCWLVIEGEVYDVSSYVDKHPAPPSVLVPWCGKEATEGMRTKGYGRDHSPAAWNMLSNYRVGSLAD